MSIQVVLNGKPTTLEDGTTPQKLLEVLSIEATRVAVELNRQIIPRAEFPTTTIQDGDVLEVVTFVGGGCC
jgi:thiamine biosynthesis protein ThiS